MLRFRLCVKRRLGSVLWREHTSSIACSEWPTRALPSVEVAQGVAVGGAQLGQCSGVNGWGSSCGGSGGQAFGTPLQALTPIAVSDDVQCVHLAMYGGRAAIWVFLATGCGRVGYELLVSGERSGEGVLDANEGVSRERDAAVVGAEAGGFEQPSIAEPSQSPPLVSRPFADTLATESGSSLKDDSVTLPGSSESSTELGGLGFSGPDAGTGENGSNASVVTNASGQSSQATADPSSSADSLSSGSSTGATTDLGSSGITTVQVSANSPSGSSQPPSSALPQWSNDFATAFNGSSSFLALGDVTISGGTLSVWFKTGASTVQYLVSKVAFGGSYAGEFRLTIEQGKVTLRVEEPAIYQVQSAGVVTDNQWHHVAAVFNPGLMLYVDGVQEAAVDVVSRSGISASGISLELGRNNALWDSYFQGSLDEVSLYSQQLSASDIAEIYNLGSPLDLSTLPTAADLVHWWRMGDGDTSPAIGDGVGGWHAVMVGMDGSNFVTDVPH